MNLQHAPIKLLKRRALLPCVLPALGAPDQFTYDEVKNSLESIEGVTQVHSLRLWSLTVDLLAVNVHLQIGKSILDLQAFHGEHFMRGRISLSGCAKFGTNSLSFDNYAPDKIKLTQK